MKGYFKENRPSLSVFFFLFQRLDKLEQFGKRPQACQMIVSHANNHLLTLSEFASDKANYHLKMSSKTLWAKGLHHDSQLYYCSYATTRPHTHTASELAAGVSYEGTVLLLHGVEIAFRPVGCCFCFVLCSVML